MITGSGDLNRAFYKEGAPPLIVLTLTQCVGAQIVCEKALTVILISIVTFRNVDKCNDT
jgi:hypothetical protein